MTLLSLTPDLAVNPALVASVSWDRSDYRPSALVITMQDGATHRVDHLPNNYGADGYEVERKLVAAANG